MWSVIHYFPYGIRVVQSSVSDFPCCKKPRLVRHRCSQQRVYNNNFIEFSERLQCHDYLEIQKHAWLSEVMAVTCIYYRQKLLLLLLLFKKENVLCGLVMCTEFNLHFRNLSNARCFNFRYGNSNDKGSSCFLIEK